MFTILVVLISLLSMFLIAIVLLQSGKGGGLAAEFGGASSSTDSIMGGRQAANVLTRATWIGGGLFLGLALLLAVMSARTTGPAESILRSEFQSPTTAPTSVLDSEGEAVPPSMLQDDAVGGEGQEPVPAGTPPQDRGRGRLELRWSTLDSLAGLSGRLSGRPDVHQGGAGAGRNGSSGGTSKKTHESAVLLLRLDPGLEARRNETIERRRGSGRSDREFVGVLVLRMLRVALDPAPFDPVTPRLCHQSLPAGEVLDRPCLAPPALSAQP